MRALVVQRAGATVRLYSGRKAIVAQCLDAAGLLLRAGAARRTNCVFVVGWCEVPGAHGVPTSCWWSLVFVGEAVRPVVLGHVVRVALAVLRPGRGLLRRSSGEVPAVAVAVLERPVRHPLSPVVAGCVAACIVGLGPGLRGRCRPILALVCADRLPKSWGRVGGSTVVVRVFVKVRVVG